MRGKEVYTLAFDLLQPSFHLLKLTTRLVQGVTYCPLPPLCSSGTDSCFGMPSTTASCQLSALLQLIWFPSQLSNCSFSCSFLPHQQSLRALSLFLSLHLNDLPLLSGHLRPQFPSQLRQNSQTPLCFQLLPQPASFHVSNYLCTIPLSTDV